MSTATEVTTRNIGRGESIRFEASSRAQAESLRHELAEFAPQLIRGEAGWIVEIAPDRRLTPLLLKLFHAVSDWLIENRLASVEVQFGDARYTLLRASDNRLSHSSEFLLQRVIQLQTALESRVAIEQATGLIAGLLRTTVEEAFEILRHAARGTGRLLHELAEEVVRAGELPPDVKRASEARQRRG